MDQLKKKIELILLELQHELRIADDEEEIKKRLNQLEELITAVKKFYKIK